MEYIPAKTIVTRNKSTAWFGANYNMNIYKGCCHGCIYCDSRSECYHVENFDRVRAKANALEIIRNDLRRKVRTGVIATGAMSDPYNPFEKELKLTRHALELIYAYGFGVAIDTKSDLISRDIDVLQDIASASPVIAKLTVTAAEDGLCGKIEPNAPLSSQRFAAIRKLADAGIFAGVLMMPILPFLEDNEKNVLGIVHMASESGARFVYPAFGMTQRQGQREFFHQKLDELFPGEGLADKYRTRYGDFYQCSSPRAKALWNVFCDECDRLGLLYRMEDIVSAYKTGYTGSQLSFYEL